MENLNKALEVTNEFDFIIFCSALLLCVICAFILRHLFNTKTIFSSNQISTTIPLLSIITFLVISVVKSSLALSLGLVGALSIIRFRTPIKNPEELIYLFMALSLGIGFGANQILMTIIVFVVFIFVLLLFNRKNTLKKNDDFNLLIRIKDNSFQKNDTYDEVVKNVNSIFEQNSLSKYEKTDDQNFSLLFKLKNVDQKKINELEKKLSLNIKNLEFYFFDDTDQTV
jgi:cell division protein FtsB